MENFLDYCKDYINDNLGGYEGRCEYASDIAYTITMGPNMDGSLTYSRAKASEYLGYWWQDASEYWEYEQSNFGEHPHDPFDESEAYMVCMVIHGVDSILSQCPTISECDDKITLDEETINAILSEVNNVNEINY